jgi:hypothetical protein
MVGVVASQDDGLSEGQAIPPLSVKDVLDRRFQQGRRRSIQRWAVSLLVVIVLALGVFQAYFQVEFGTFEWWSAPPHIPYCGWNYVPVTGLDSRADALGVPARLESSPTANRASLGKLVEIMSIPPLSRPVFAAPEAFPGGLGKCADPIFYQTGTGALVEYGAPTS